MEKIQWHHWFRAWAVQAPAWMLAAVILVYSVFGTEG